MDKMKILFHNDQAIMLKNFPNKFFIKHRDNIKKDCYIIVESKKYYLEDLLNEWQKENHK